MTHHDTSYKNRPKNLPREVGRIHRDLAALDEKRIAKLSSNVYAVPGTPPTTSEGDGAACCCDRTVYVSKDGNGDFDTIQEAIDDIASYETPSATEPWIIYICPGEYTEDVVGADYVSLIGIGTKKDGARIIGVDGPTYTCPDGPHSVENVMFELAVDAGTATPILIYAVDVPSTADECHNFVNCQFKITDESQPGELLRISGTEISFEECDFHYDNTGATVGANTHNLFNIIGSVDDVRLISCRIIADIAEEADNLTVVNETDTYASRVMIKDCRARITATHALARGTYIFYNAFGDGEEKYVQDNHVEFSAISVAGNIALFISMINAKSITVTSNNNHVSYNITTPYITSVAITNTLYSHHDQFIDLRWGLQVPYVNNGTFEHVHSSWPGQQHLTRHQDIDLPPGGSFYLTANQAGLVAGAWRVVQITGVDWQKGGTAPSAPNYVYVPGIVGTYVVSAAAHYIAATVTDGAEYRVGISLNGTVIKYVTPHAGAAAFLGSCVTAIIQITAITDTIGLQIYHTSGVNQTVRGTSATTYLAVHKVS